MRSAIFFGFLLILSVALFFEWNYIAGLLFGGVAAVLIIIASIFSYINKKKHKAAEDVEE